MATQQFTMHADLPKVKQALSDKDVMVVDIADTSTPSKYLTVNTNLQLASRSVQTIINENSAQPFIFIKPDGGLMGTGTVDDPLALDMDLIKKKWTSSAYSNVVQIGKYGSPLPIKSNTSASSIALTVMEDIHYHVSGTSGVLKGGIVWNSYFYPVAYIYLVIVNGKAQLIVSDSLLPETVSRVYLGVRTATAQVEGTLQPVFRISESRISVDPIGGAIPASTGNPVTPTNTPWGIKTIQSVSSGIVNDGTLVGKLEVDPAARRLIIQTPAEVYFKSPSTAVEKSGDYFITGVISSSTTVVTSIYINGSRAADITGSSYTPINITPYLRDGINKFSATSPVQLSIAGLFVGDY